MPSRPVLPALASVSAYDAIGISGGHLSEKGRAEMTLPMLFDKKYGFAR